MEEAKEKRKDETQSKTQNKNEAQNEAWNEIHNDNKNGTLNGTKDEAKNEKHDNAQCDFQDKGHKLEAGEEDQRAKRLKLIIDIVLSAVFVGIIIYLTVVFGQRFTRMAAEPEKLHEMLSTFGWKGVLIFIALQILQVVVAALPGQFIQIAGGYIYGPWLGTLYSMAGIMIGSVIVFCVAKFLGYRIVKLVVSRKQLDKLSFMMNSEKSGIGVFILYLIPGLPKDVFSYIAGITPIKAMNFFIVMMLGRLPALFGSAYIGNSMQEGNYSAAIIVGAAAVILFAAGLIFKNKIIVKIRTLTMKNK